MSHDYNFFSEEVYSMINNNAFIYAAPLPEART